MRRSVRNAEGLRAVENEKARLLAQTPHIIWVFYNGPVRGGKLASGYNVEQHESWCIPLSLWRNRDKMTATKFTQEASYAATRLRFLDDGVTRRNYHDPENKKWWVLAPHPSANPKFGTIVRAQAPDRAKLQMVQADSVVTGGDIQTRLQRLKGKQNSTDSDTNYPGADELWVASIRVKKDGHVDIYPDDVMDNKPLLTIYRNAARFQTLSTKFDHDPQDMVFKSHAVNPASKDLPSTNTIPVQTFQITNPNFLVFAAVAASISQYIQDRVRETKRERTTKHKIVPTEYIDYEDLRRDS